MTDQDTLLADAKNYLIQGKRHLLVADYEAAVESLQEACKLYDVRYGPAARECGEPYLCYGSALLELARIETGALGGIVDTKVDGDEEDEDEEGDEAEGEEEEAEEDDDDGEPPATADKADVPADKAASPVVEEEEDLEATKKQDEEVEPAATSEQKSDAEPEKSVKATDEPSGVSALDAGSSTEPKPSVSAGPSTSSTDTPVEPAASSSSSSSSSATTAAVDPTQPSTSSGTGQGKSAASGEDAGQAPEEDNNASDMEIAWETLVVAKSIFEQFSENDDEMRLKLAETWMKLGEISIEWENYDTALETLMKSLSLRKELLPADDRLIAETYYYMGLAYSLQAPDNFSQANDCFGSAIAVLENRITNLQIKGAESNGAPPVWQEKCAREIADLTALVAEMKSRIEDSNDQMGGTKRVLEEVAKDEEVEQLAATRAAQLADKPVQNISHLIKRKRTDEEEETKDIKSDETLSTNGDNGDKTATENGTPPISAKKLCTESVVGAEPQTANGNGDGPKVELATNGSSVPSTVE